MTFRLTTMACLLSALLCSAPAVQAQLQDTSVAGVETRAVEDVPATERESAPPVDIWDRIRRGYGMNDLNGPRYRAALKMYARNPKYIQDVSSRAGKYLYHIVEEVERRGMPSELALLPFVESAFQPEAKSYAKAAGLWQFMPATGNVFSLQQNLWKDERRDVLESTRAALDYLQKLYGMFGDWHLALAAYNWGEGSVQKAIRYNKQRKRKTSYPYLRMPKETANYVPRLLAIKELVANPDKYGISLPEIENAPYFVRIAKSHDIDLKTAAALAEMDEAEFKLLNPGFNLPVIVASHNSVILLPEDNVEIFMNNLASWVNTGKPLSSWTLYRVQPDETLKDIAETVQMTEDELRRINHIPKDRNVLPGSMLLVSANGQSTGEITADTMDARLNLSAPATRRVIYRVKKGDTIYDIAVKYGITQETIRKHNRLKSSSLRIGQRLVLIIGPKTTLAKGQRLHVVQPGQTLSTIAQRYGVSVSSIRRMNKLKGSQIKVGQKLIVGRAARRATYVSDTTHIVRSGDSLGTIARKYGVTVNELRQLNNLSSNTIRVGQAIDVGKPIASSSEPHGEDVHVVRPGESLNTIARRYGLSVEQLRRQNDLSSYSIRVGQYLKVGPADIETQVTVHTVQEGESLGVIAERYGMGLNRLRRINNLKNDSVRVGQTLRVIPGAQTKTQEGTAPNANVHVVQAGESLGVIARKYGMRLTVLRQLNGLKNNTIRVGQTLKIQKPAVSNQTPN